MNAPAQPLRLLDGNTVFSAVRFWLHENGTTGKTEIRQAPGCWGWESVLSVQRVDPAVMLDMPEPRCLVEQAGQYIYLRADYEQVQAAWRRWRLFSASPLLKFTSAN